jgi:hypothetical protein
MNKTKRQFWPIRCKDTNKRRKRKEKKAVFYHIGILGLPSFIPVIHLSFTADRTIFAEKIFNYLI